MRRGCRVAMADLSEKIRTDYPRDGFVSPLELFSEAYFARYDVVGAYRRFKARAAASEAPMPAWNELRFKSHMYLPWLHRMLFDKEHNENLRAAAQALLKCDDIVVWSTDWCVKPAETPFRFSWHQDSTYSKISGAQGSTVWLAFTEVREEHGPLLFRPGTHKWGQFFHYETQNDGENLLAFGQTIPRPPGAPPDAEEPEPTLGERLTPEQQRWMETPVVAAAGLRPGLASAHSFEVVHSSSANRATSDRVGLAVRLLRADAARRADGTLRRDRVTLLCGSADKVAGFELEEHVPQQEFGKEEMAEWQKSLDREKESYFASLGGATDAAEGESEAGEGATPRSYR